MYAAHRDQGLLAVVAEALRSAQDGDPVPTTAYAAVMAVRRVGEAETAVLTFSRDILRYRGGKWCVGFTCARSVLLLNGA
jgi:hypothetical protein